MNYIVRGFEDLKFAAVAGVIIYAVFLLLMYAFKKRRGISWKCVPEMAFCVYGVWLLKVTGIFSLHFSIGGIMSYNLVPFIGSSFMPVLLNTLLFFPYGFLLPLVFTACKWNWKKILGIGAATSLVIEILQLFGGRYAEVEDLLANALGTLTGYLVCAGIRNFRGNRKKTLFSFGVLTIAAVVGFGGIYLVGDHAEELPDGLSSVKDSISEIRIYYKGDSRVIPIESDIYNYFEAQLSNCGGHRLKIDKNPDSEVINDNDCFIGILFDTPQNISFYNGDHFMIFDAERILYNTSQNMIFWGQTGYRFCADYTEFEPELEEHKAEILAQYQILQEMIIQQFE